MASAKRCPNKACADSEKNVRVLKTFFFFFSQQRISQRVVRISLESRDPIASEGGGGVCTSISKEIYKNMSYVFFQKFEKQVYFLA